MGGRGGGFSSGGFMPHCTTSILCGEFGWLSGVTMR
jgi:hypothetical protein